MDLHVTKAQVERHLVDSHIADRKRSPFDGIADIQGYVHKKHPPGTISRFQEIQNYAGLTDLEKAFVSGGNGPNSRKAYYKDAVVEASPEFE